ncbi:hypothetical protein [Brevibacterium aurantiacum]|uniref:Uncharacterized protein n=1 Tax=Brevibacterium aurantiacum TaxID=273384 RepID=A0A2A3X5X3_BREAU|nr:hypothetical protein [Brevibacterium aurantiacum]PCC18897.1 hypothetical protein CIK79_11705 [Brevibacterium aurantiacum]
MAATYEEFMTIPFAAADVWRRAIDVINQQPGVTGVHMQPGRLSASVNVSWRSWGENLTVNVDEVPGGTVVRIRSECAFPLQIIDWGKNRDNVSQIKRGLEPPHAPEAGRR